MFNYRYLCSVGYFKQELSPKYDAIIFLDKENLYGKTLFSPVKEYISEIKQEQNKNIDAKLRHKTKQELNKTIRLIGYYPNLEYALKDYANLTTKMKNENIAFCNPEETVFVKHYGNSNPPKDFKGTVTSSPTYAECTK